MEFSALAEYFESEVLPIMKTISVFFQSLDHVIEPLAQTIGLVMLEEVHNSKASSVEHLHILQNLGDATFSDPSFPVFKFHPSPVRIFQTEDDSQILFEDICHVEGFVDCQQLPEPDVLLPRQSFLGTQEQVTTVFEVLPPFWRQLALQSTTDVVDGQTHGLDDMKMVVDQVGSGTFGSDFQLVGIVHIDDHQFDPAGAFLSKPVEELAEHFPVSVLAHPDHPPLSYIRNQRQIPMPFLFGNFVDSQIGDSVQIPLSKQSQGIVNFGFSDQSPVGMSQIRYLLYRLSISQFEKPSFESMCASCVFPCYQKHAALHPTQWTINPVTRYPQPHLMRGDTEIPEPHPSAVVIDQKPATACTTSPPRITWFKPNLYPLFMMSLPLNNFIALQTDERINSVNMGHKSSSRLRVVSNNSIPEGKKVNIQMKKAGYKDIPNRKKFEIWGKRKEIINIKIVSLR